MSAVEPCDEPPASPVRIARLAWDTLDTLYERLMADGHGHLANELECTAMDHLGYMLRRLREIYGEVDA